ncbi:MAG: TIGR01777 family oxidoreductase [Bacteroidota bacterium]
MVSKTILITGGTGLVGSALATHLVANGHKVIILSRKSEKEKGRGDKNNVQYAQWDVKAQTIDESAIKDADVIVHLAGAGVVDKPWTDAYKKEILDSRVQSASLLVKAMREIPNNIETVISASAIGWYGADKQGSEPFTESSPAAPGFLGDTCRKWEDSIKPVLELNKRLVVYRFGIVLAREGGALKEFIKPLKARVAGVIGNGKQTVSWIHIHDLCRLLLFAIEQPQLNGIYNAVAPVPVSNETLTLTLAKVMHANAFIKTNVPEFVLKIMMGERSVEVLKSTTVSSKKIETAGFQFQFPKIEQAIANIMHS